MTEKNEPSPQERAAATRAANREAEEAKQAEAAAAAEENTGAASAESQAVRTGVSSDDLNPAFASPEVQEQVKKNWAGEAEHEVDAEAVIKEAEKDAK